MIVVYSWYSVARTWCSEKSGSSTTARPLVESSYVEGVLCTCKHLRRRLLADPEEDQVYVFDVTEFSECVPCGAGGACDVGECVPDTRRRGLRFGMSTSGCCRGA